MAEVVVIGLQWGDEGKGKIVDYLSKDADVIVRFQGGHNAGHTIVAEGLTYKLSIIPSGIIRKGKISVIGNGAVLDPYTFLNELENLRNQGIEVSSENLYIADNIPVVLSLNKDLDIILDNLRGKSKIGTTGRGIGSTYEDKVGRRAIRVSDLYNELHLKGRLEILLDYHNALRRGLGEKEVDLSEITKEIKDISDKILPFSRPVWKDLYEMSKEKKNILFEGAQGMMLDIDHGTYPFVTSSSTVAGNVFSGTGTAIGSIDSVLGIVKAYSTRVGSGPFITEQNNSLGQYLMTKGKEFGTVTGRERRCGWFDAVMVSQAIKISGVTDIVLTKLDILDDLESVKICTGYRYKGKDLDHLPSSISVQEDLEPVYEDFEGWEGKVSGAKNFEDLPKNAVKYIKKLEQLLGVPVTIISTGPGRDDTIVLSNPFLS